MKQKENKRAAQRRAHHQETTTTAVHTHTHTHKHNNETIRKRERMKKKNLKKKILEIMRLRGRRGGGRRQTGKKKQKKRNRNVSISRCFLFFGLFFSHFGATRPISSWLDEFFYFFLSDSMERIDWLFFFVFFLVLHDLKFEWINSALLLIMKFQGLDVI